jgi:hypothetical protein
MISFLVVFRIMFYVKEKYLSIQPLANYLVHFKLQGICLFRLQLQIFNLIYGISCYEDNFHGRVAVMQHHRPRLRRRSERGKVSLSLKTPIKIYPRRLF